MVRDRGEIDCHFPFKLCLTLTVFNKQARKAEGKRLDLGIGITGAKTLVAKLRLEELSLRAKGKIFLLAVVIPG